MQSSHPSLYGLQTQFPVTKLSKNAFDSVDFDLYPPLRQHFLIYALQNQHKLPSQISMLRSQRRNQIKSGQGEANKKVGRPSKIIHNPKRGKTGTFYLPQKKMPKPIRRRGRWITERSIYNRSKPAKTAKRKQRKWAFKISSPEKIALKCERAAIKQKLQKWRKENPPKIVEEVEARPAYFLKKKANQKRRRLQKHNLIKKNRKALIEIYGAAIFQRGWPVSRAQIKAALGIKQQDHLPTSIEGLADLVKQQ